MISAHQRTTGFARVNGAKLYYEVAGEGHPLLLIHGGLVDSRMWDDHFDVLAGHFRVIRFDMRGFGKSVLLPGEFSFHEDVRGLLQALRIERAHVMGLSMGGMVSIDFALTHPEMVDALVLVASALGGYRFSGETAQRIDEVDEALEAGDVSLALELENRIWVDGPSRSPEDIDPKVRERVREMNAQIYAMDSDEATPHGPDVPAGERLADIKVPTLVMVGDQDVPDMLAIADLLATGIPNARKVVIPNTAHHLPMEQPEEFTHIVLEFLQSL